MDIKLFEEARKLQAQIDFEEVNLREIKVSFAAAMATDEGCIASFSLPKDAQSRAFAISGMTLRNILGICKSDCELKVKLLQDQFDAL